MVIASTMLDMRLSQKDLRIQKLLDKGVPPAVIAKKIGYGGMIDEGLARIKETQDKIVKIQQQKNL